MRLLHRCLAQRRPRRSRRSATGLTANAAGACIATLDSALEVRLLLSANVADAQAFTLVADTVAAESEQLVQIFSVTTKVISVGREDSVALPVATAPPGNVSAHMDKLDGSVVDEFTFRYDFSGSADNRVSFDRPQLLEDSTRNGLVVSAPLRDHFSDSVAVIARPQLDTALTVEKLLPAPATEQTLRVLPEIRSTLKFASVVATPTAEQTPPIAQHNIEVRATSSTSYASAATASAPDVFHSLTDSMPSLADPERANTVLNVGASSTVRSGAKLQLPNSRFRHVQPSAKGRQVSDDALLTLRADTSGNTVTAETLTGSRAPSAPQDIGDLIDVLVQLDAVGPFTTEVGDVSTWLQAQLLKDSRREAVERGSAEESPNVCVDNTATEALERSGQREQHAFSRLEILTSDGLAILLLSDNPPEPPEIAGIWQQLKFDCNPRGPPVSDSHSASEFTQLTARIKQRQQLRYSITPRGPSAASTF